MECFRLMPDGTLQPCEDRGERYVEYIECPADDFQWWIPPRRARRRRARAGHRGRRGATRVSETWIPVRKTRMVTGMLCSYPDPDRFARRGDRCSCRIYWVAKAPDECTLWLALRRMLHDTGRRHDSALAAEDFQRYYRAEIERRWLTSAEAMRTVKPNLPDWW
jgi:hypothetical protein